jgi:hypothetical protein
LPAGVVGGAVVDDAPVGQLPVGHALPPQVGQTVL